MKKGICLLFVLVIFLTGTASQVLAENIKVEGVSPETSKPIQHEQSLMSNDKIFLLASNQDRDHDRGQDRDRDRDRGQDGDRDRDRGQDGDRDRDQHKHRPNCGQFNKQACNSHYPDCCWASCNSHSGNCVPCR